MDDGEKAMAAHVLYVLVHQSMTCKDVARNALSFATTRAPGGMVGAGFSLHCIALHVASGILYSLL
jgi:hypothetical protein